MFTTFFDLKLSDGIIRDGRTTFNIPILPAYAIEHSDFLLNGLDSNEEDTDYKIEDSDLILLDITELSNDDKLRLVIHYHGIRSYELLFPNINDNDLAVRLGRFYEEAEKSFESGSWLSYCLMCGAIFEGILFSLIGQNKKFADLIIEAANEGLIDSEDKVIMDQVRKFRNLIHASKFRDAYVSRKSGMDTRTVLDKLIKKI